MVPCLCIDDTLRPKEIPASKWVRQFEKYTVIFTVKCLPQKIVGYQLAEIELGENELPYEYFAARRFAFRPEDLQALSELIKDCTDLTTFDINKLIEETQLQEL